MDGWIDGCKRVCACMDSSSYVSAPLAVCLFGCLPVCLSVPISISSLLFIFLNLHVRLPVSLFVRPSVCLCLSACLPLCIPFSPSVHPTLSLWLRTWHLQGPMLKTYCRSRHSLNVGIIHIARLPPSTLVGIRRSGDGFLALFLFRSQAPEEMRLFLFPFAYISILW